MRAFRPSHFSIGETDDELSDPERQENVRRYTERATAGLPLFDANRVALSSEVFGAGMTFLGK